MLCLTVTTSDSTNACSKFELETNEDAYAASPPLQSSSDQASSPSSSSLARDPCWADNMLLLWSKMPKGVMTAVLNKARLCPKDQKILVSVMVDEMLTHPPNPNFKQSMVVAKRIAAKNPESFEDRTVDGYKIGMGYVSLAKQIRIRIENLTRGDQTC